MFRTCNITVLVYYNLYRMYTLGLNLYHADCSASIFHNSELVAAAEEERFLRKKHWAGIPFNSINFCLKSCSIEINDVDVITVNSNLYSNILSKVAYLIKNPNLSLLSSALKRRRKKESLQILLGQYFKTKKKFKIVKIDHHLSHIASAYFPSGFKDCLSISIDGFGDFCSIVISYCNDGKIKILKKIKFPNSLGVFYEGITQTLGFKNYGDEYKVMGLAPYGKAIYYDLLSELFVKKTLDLNLEYFNHDKKNFTYNFEGIPNQSNLISDKFILRIKKELEKNNETIQSNKNLAFSAQKIFEEKVFLLFEEKFLKFSKNLTLSGGCSMNSSCNGKIYKKNIFENIFIPPAPGDAGGAIGSSLFYLKKKFKPNQFKNINNPFLGPSYKNSEIKKLIEKNDKLLNFKIYYYDDSELEKKIANYLSKGDKVIGWFQGSMEFGPRALGNRSILSDPRNSNMKDIINSKIKLRENFRPFAPSILDEYKYDWFHFNANSDYMSFVADVREEKRNIIPAVTHVDGTGRLQTVKKHVSKKFYNLINEFNNLTKVPILLNTSFNENEPIVQHPDEAIGTFLRTKMDALVLENHCIFRSE